MKDELNYKDFYEETIDLQKPTGVRKNSQIFLWGGWALSAILFIVFIFSGGGSDVKSSADSRGSFLGSITSATDKTAGTIFGSGSSEHLVETIDLNSPGDKNAQKQAVAPYVPKVQEKININTAGLSGLDELSGVGPAVAQKIIDYRNTNGLFQKIEDIKNVNGIGQATFENFKDKITVGNIPVSPPVISSVVLPIPAPQPSAPVSPPPAPAPAPVATQEKININTAGLEELDKITGVGPSTAKNIIADRDLNGLFYKIEDIKRVNGIGDVTFEKMRNQITVGNVKAPPVPLPVPAPVPPPAPAPQPTPPPAPAPQPVPPPVPAPQPAPVPLPPAPEPVPPPADPSPPPEPSPAPSPAPEPVPPPEPEPTPPPAPEASPEPVSPPAPEPPPPTSSAINHILISEVMVGNDENSNNEFIELYNPTAIAIDLTGWYIKKKVSSGTESPLLVASRLDGKIIPPGKYFLAVNATYISLQGDVTWAASNTLAYTNNRVTLYDGLGAAIDSAAWTEIPKNESYERESWDSDTFRVQTAPSPMNSQN